MSGLEEPGLNRAMRRSLKREEKKKKPNNQQKVENQSTSSTASNNYSNRSSQTTRDTGILSEQRSRELHLDFQGRKGKKQEREKAVQEKCHTTIAKHLDSIISDIIQNSTAAQDIKFITSYWISTSPYEILEELERKYNISNQLDQDNLIQAASDITTYLIRHFNSIFVNSLTVIAALDSRIIKAGITDEKGMINVGREVACNEIRKLVLQYMEEDIERDIDTLLMVSDAVLDVFAMSLTRDVFMSGNNPNTMLCDMATSLSGHATSFLYGVSSYIGDAINEKITESIIIKSINDEKDTIKAAAEDVSKLIADFKI